MAWSSQNYGGVPSNEVGVGGKRNIAGSDKIQVKRSYFDLLTA